MEIALNSAHDPAALAPAYAEHARIQIRDFFTVPTADAIYNELYNLPWHLVYNEGQTAREVTPEQLRALSPDDAAAIRQQVDQGAVSGFQYLYNHYSLSTQYFRDGGKGLALYRFFEFINSRAMLAFLRELTGCADTVWVDSHATLYRAGHFLKYHTDKKPGDNRLAAYVFSFTRDWGRDWGGLLQFWNEQYDVECALRPVFNALNIFTVPAHHSVSAVVPWSPGLRFSITGWLRCDEPPAPIPLG